MANNEMTIGEFTGVLNYLLDNNKKLQEQGQTPIAICLEGEAGIGKTSLVRQVAEQRGMTYRSIVLSQLEEVGDLCGYPQKEVLLTCTVNGQTKKKWWPENMLDKVPQNANVTSTTRMSYAPPAWLPREDNPNGTMLVLDDFSRASQMLLQSAMEIINTASYISWKLPKNTSVILTSNPDDGSYSVVSLDNAQKTRMVTFNIKLCVEDWAKWAEFNGIDSRAINFALLNSEEMFKKHNGIQTVNPRAYTMFCKAISGIDNWENPDSLALILNLSKGCFLNDENNAIGRMFTTFIHQKLDKLVNPKDMLMGKWETVEPRIFSCVYTDGSFKPEIASILAIRLLNHILYYFSQKGVKENVVQDRLLDFIHNKRKLFSDDLLFHTIKTVIAKYPQRTGKLLMIPEIRNKIMI